MDRTDFMSLPFMWNLLIGHTVGEETSYWDEKRTGAQFNDIRMEVVSTYGM